MARPEGVALAAEAAEVATNSGPMIIGGGSVTTGEGIPERIAERASYGGAPAPTGSLLHNLAPAGAARKHSAPIGIW
jgi:hypothetical protein